MVGSNGGPVLQNRRSGLGEVTDYSFKATASGTGFTPSLAATSSTIEFDTTPPAITLDTASSVDTPPSTISGTIAFNAQNPADDQDSALPVMITDADTLNGVTTTTTTTTKAVGGAFSVPFVSAAGTHVITASATDAAGNVGTSASITVTVDLAVAPPAVTISTPSPVVVSATGTPTITITGTIDASNAGDVITVDNTGAMGTTALGTTTADGSGHWSLTTTLPAAPSYALSATATNGIGTGTSAAIALQNLTFAPTTAVNALNATYTIANAAFAQSIAGEIDGAAPSSVDTILTNGSVTVPTTATSVVDNAPGATSLTLADFPDIIGGSGGTTLYLTGTSGGQSQKIALVGGTNTIEFANGGYNADIEATPATTALLFGGGAIASTSGLEEVAEKIDAESFILAGANNTFYFDPKTSGGTLFDTGSSDVIVAGNGTTIVGSKTGTTVVQAGGGATFFSTGGADTLIANGTASDSLIAVASSGSHIVIGGDSTSRASLGVIAFAGAGIETIDASSLKGVYFVVAGTGNATLVGGSGPTFFDFTNGAAGGSDIIGNFHAGDTVILSGYRQNAYSNAVAAGQATTLGFQITLSDGTKITFAGLTAAPPAAQVFVDGYVTGGTVGYLNGSGATTVTGPSGAFSLTGGTGAIVGTGGTDMATGLANTVTFEAPAGASVLSPVTTLLQKVVEASGDLSAAGIAAANADLVAALGLPAGTDLTTLDPEAGTLAGDATATKAFIAGSALLDLSDLVNAAGGSNAAALTALAANILAGTPLDLTNSATLTAAAVAGGLQPTTASAVASVITATDAALAQQLATATNPTSVFLAIAGASRAEQGTASDAIASALASGGVAAVAAAATTYAQTAASTLSAAIATVTGSSTLPTIAGTLANQAVADNATVKPFALVTITDPGASAQEMLIISVGADGAASDADGLLSGPDLTETAPGTYELVEPSAAALTRALDALTFNPTLQQVTPGGSVTTSFKLAVTDGIAPEIDDSTTSVVATATSEVPIVTLLDAGGRIGTIDPSISGTVDLADASGTVQIYENGIAVGTPVAVTAQGTFATTLAIPRDGTYAVTATKSNGNSVGMSNAVTFELDSTQNAPLFGSTTKDVSSAAGEVYAFYETILGRAPDPTGFEGWVADLETGTSLATIAQDFLASPEYASDYGSSTQSNTGFVAQLYQDGLHRAPDPAGGSGWVNALDNGSLTRAQVAVGIATSQESSNDLAPTFQAGVFVPDAADAAVARLYYGLLGRAPDAGGLQLWEGVVFGGNSVTQVAQDFLGSPEYETTAAGQSNLQFVQGLYQSALGRTGEPAGVQTWEVALDGGSQTRAGVVLGFLDSAEFTADEAGKSNSSYVDTLYEVALGRPVDPSGQQTWVTALNNGSLTRNAVAQDIVGSAEFQANVTAPEQAGFVDAIYQGVFGRAASASEIQGWQSALSSGTTPVGVAIGIAESAQAAVQLAPKIEAGFHIA